MPSQLSAALLLDEAAQQAAPRSATRTSGPARTPDALTRISGPLFDNANERLQPDPLVAASSWTSTPRRRIAAPGLTVGVLLYLFSVGLVAAAIVVISVGAGFSSLGHPTAGLIAGFGTRDRGTEAGPSSPVGFAYSEGVALPREQNPAELEAFPPQSGDRALGFVPNFSARTMSANATGGGSSTLKAPALRSATRKARTKPVQTSPARHDATLTPPTRTGAAPWPDVA